MYASTNAYVLPTPYTSYRIQEFFEYKAVFDDTSKTGMRKWVPECNCMREWKSDMDMGDDDTSKDYPRKPMVQGVAVATLLGFYDPRGEKETYIYPALHGAYGNAFKESSDAVIEKSRCIANVMNNEGEKRKYVLKGERQGGHESVMNKFHINVEESFNPKTINIQCKDSGEWKNLDSREISKPRKNLVYMINGKGLYCFQAVLVKVLFVVLSTRKIFLKYIFFYLKFANRMLTFS